MPVGLTFREIAAVVRELQPAVAGARIQKVFQPAPRTIVLEIRAPGRTLSVLVSADPQTARLHVLHRPLPNPAVPPPFCQFLRARLQGGRIETVELQPNDRIVRFRVMARGGRSALLGQLTGRSADILLLDETGNVLGSLNQPRLAGTPYAAPPAAAKTEAAADEAEPPPPGDEPFPISWAIEQRYGEREAGAIATRLRLARLTALRKAIKKAARRAEALRTDLEKAARYSQYGRYGELLKANLRLIKKGEDRFTVTDYFDPGLPELVLPLDPAKSPQGNMEDYFRKHRKALSAEREIRPRLEELEQTLARLRSEAAAIQQGSWEPPRTAEAPGPPPSAPRPVKRTGPFRRFVSADGLPIYVGRNARENEELTFKVARSDDLWLHAHGTPGSHVVIRLAKGTDPPLETLKDAATLALLYSDLKKSGKGEVLYAKRKWVRKAKGRAPGTVTVTQEKTLFLTLDRARLARLKEGQQRNSES
jgi:predicted ribosome quality control (RQC) complex YloA/Tae2 family protein